MSLSQGDLDALSCPFAGAAFGLDEQGKFWNQGRRLWVTQHTSAPYNLKHALARSIVQATTLPPPVPEWAMFAQLRAAHAAIGGEMVARTVLARVYGDDFARLAPLVFTREVGDFVRGPVNRSVVEGLGYAGLSQTAGFFQGWAQQRGVELRLKDTDEVPQTTIFLGVLGAGISLTTAAAEEIRQTGRQSRFAEAAPGDQWDDELRYLLGKGEG